MSETRAIISGEQLQLAFKEQDWPSLWIKLIAHTIFRLTKRYGIKSAPDDLRSRAQEVISEVINSIFIEETRKWYPDSKSTVEELLYSSIDSHLYNSFNTDRKELTGQDDHVFEKAEEGNTAEEQLLAKELQEEIIQDLKNMGADDDELLVFDCLLEGITTPRHIRQELGISEQDFHNIWRRLGRKRDRIADKLLNYGKQQEKE